MILTPFIVLFLLRFLRKTLKTFSPDPVWEKKLLRLMYVVSVVLFIDIVAKTTHVSMWIWHLVLFVIIYITYNIPTLAPARRVMLAVLPIIVLTFISDLLEVFFHSFYSKIEDYLDLADAIAITWMVTMLIISGKQMKALEKERLARLAEEERHRFIEAQKNELEKQVAERTRELTHQKEELENALVELQSTQKQLIQSEKMASLGELTAGIAHEIQNPLNFVNNFSEVSVELIAEMKEELKTGNSDAVSAIAEDLKNNLEKIAHHGRRADGIVKGMLQHSRSSTGVKEATDINGLADEYLRLSYHGLRAKDKNFNATMNCEFDETIGLVDIIPQDIGRVMLNLFTNAFYSVSAKRKVLCESGVNYEPTVLVKTKLHRKAGENGEDIISVCVRDNGLGIPKRVVDKIYQPFFTTKPSGEGTGLGLSLSYDIINKGHGGKMTVDTKEGEYAEFTIELPAIRNTQAGNEKSAG